MANGEKHDEWEIRMGLRCPKCRKVWTNHGWNGGIEKTCNCVLDGWREQPQEPSFEGIGSFHGAANQDSHSRSSEGGEKPVAYRQAPRPSGQISLAPELEPATPAPGAPCPKCGAWRDGERVISPPGGFVPCNHQWHGERPITTASPRSGLGANWLRQRHFFVTGCDKGALVTLDDALAHAAEQVRQRDEAAESCVADLLTEVTQLRQERDALKAKLEAFNG